MFGYMLSRSVVVVVFFSANQMENQQQRQQQQHVCICYCACYIQTKDGIYTHRKWTTWRVQKKNRRDAKKVRCCWLFFSLLLLVFFLGLWLQAKPVGALHNTKKRFEATFMVLRMFSIVACESATKHTGDDRYASHLCARETDRRIYVFWFLGKFYFR